MGASNAGTLPHDFASAHLYIGAHKDRKIVPSIRDTDIHRVSNAPGRRVIALRYHYTNVVIWQENGVVMLNTGGWNTATTKARINDCCPAGYAVFQKDFSFYLSTPHGEPLSFHRVAVIDTTNGEIRMLDSVPDYHANMGAPIMPDPPQTITIGAVITSDDVIAPATIRIIE